jgi:hypothetical protein
MAINPNTDFSSGAVLTAAQQNRFPRGVMAFGQASANSSITLTETTQITASAFTAVANRYYRIIYYEPTASPAAGAGSYINLLIKNGATQLQIATIQNTGATQSANGIIVQLVTTFSAGSVTLTARASGTAGGFLYRASAQLGQLTVEDIGPS